MNSSVARRFTIVLFIVFFLSGFPVLIAGAFRSKWFCSGIHSKNTPHLPDWVEGMIMIFLFLVTCIVLWLAWMLVKHTIKYIVKGHFL